MTSLNLTPAQRRAHRAAAHHLQPVVAIGADGLTPAVAQEADAALRAHGLIKIRAHSDDREVREAWLGQLSDTLGAAPIQHIGKLLILWRPIPPKESVERDDRKPGPKLVKIVKFSKTGNHRPQIAKVRVLGNERVTAGGSVKRARKAVLRSVKKTVAE